MSDKLTKPDGTPFDRPQAVIKRTDGNKVLEYRVDETGLRGKESSVYLWMLNRYWRI